MKMMTWLLEQPLNWLKKVIHDFHSSALLIITIENCLIGAFYLSPFDKEDRARSKNNNYYINIPLSKNGKTFTENKRPYAYA